MLSWGRDSSALRREDTHIILRDIVGAPVKIVCYSPARQRSD